MNLDYQTGSLSTAKSLIRANQRRLNTLPVRFRYSFIPVADISSGTPMVHEHHDFKRSLQIALVITTIFLVVELAGGLKCYQLWHTIHETQSLLLSCNKL
jgi:hypothetical protein